MQLLKDKTTISSLVLVEQINIFRKKERENGSTDRLHADILHKSLLEIIRDEFSEEIGQGELMPSSYFNSQNKEQPMFELTFEQSKEIKKNLNYKLSNVNLFRNFEAKTMINLKEYGFEQLGECWILKEGIYILMHSKKTVFTTLFKTKNFIDVLELYAENKNEDMVLLGEIEGEQSLKTILNLIKKSYD